MIGDPGGLLHACFFSVWLWGREALGGPPPLPLGRKRRPPPGGDPPRRCPAAPLRLLRCAPGGRRGERGYNMRRAGQVVSSFKLDQRRNTIANISGRGSIRRRSNSSLVPDFGVTFTYCARGLERVRPPTAFRKAAQILSDRLGGPVRVRPQFGVGRNIFSLL